MTQGGQAHRKHQSSPDRHLHLRLPTDSRPGMSPIARLRFTGPRRGNPIQENILDYVANSIDYGNDTCHIRCPLQNRRCPFKRGASGEMAEWLKAHAWKACVRETVPWVRIPLSPPELIEVIYIFCSISPSRPPQRTISFRRPPLVTTRKIERAHIIYEEMEPRSLYFCAPSEPITLARHGSSGACGQRYYFIPLVRRSVSIRFARQVWTTRVALS